MTTREPRYLVGDWLLVIRAGLPVVGVVLQPVDRRDYPYGWQYVTTVGVVLQDEVIECRRGTP